MASSQSEREIIEHIEENAEDNMEFLRELIRARPVNPPGDEHRAADIVRPRLESLGFEVAEYTEVEGRPNLVARRPGSGDGPTLLATAHLDVVPIGDETGWPCDPFAAEVIDGKLYGRGACDHKSPLASMLGAVEALDAADIPLAGDLIFIHDSNEEGGGEHGMEYVVENADLQADMGLYACTTSLTDDAVDYFSTQGKDNVHRANYGNQIYRIDIKGKIVHPLTPDETVSGGERLATLLPALQAYCDEVRSREVPLVGRPDAYLTTFDSEGWAGRASPRVTVHLHRYFAPSEDPDHVRSEFRDWVEDAAIEAGIAEHVSVDMIQENAAVEVEEAHPLVRACSNAAKRIRGDPPAVTGVPAQTGITWLVEELEIPMVLFGFGNVNFHHRDPEWIAPADVVDMTKAYALVFQDTLSEGAAPGEDGHKIVRSSEPVDD